MKNSDRYELRIFLTTKLISVSIFEFYTERYIVVYTVYDKMYESYSMILHKLWTIME